jgi:hypothetical protein
MNATINPFNMSQSETMGHNETKIGFTIWSESDPTVSGKIIRALRSTP